MIRRSSALSSERMSQQRVKLGKLPKRVNTVGAVGKYCRHVKVTTGFRSIQYRLRLTSLGTFTAQMLLN
jgi:hypothetical protein